MATDANIGAIYAAAGTTPSPAVPPTTPDTAFMHLNPLGKLNNELRWLILSVRDIEARITPEALILDQIKDSFAEVYPPAKLFFEELQLVTVIYTDLRNWFNLCGANIRPQSSGRS